MLQEGIGHGSRDPRSYREAAAAGDGRARNAVNDRGILSRGSPRFPSMSTDALSGPPDAIDALIQRCLAGDQAAWEQIVRQHWRKVFNIAYKFTGRHDLAEDLTQDVFVKIFKSLDTFDRRANFQTWLVSVSRNLCIDHYRSVRKERETIDRDVDPGDLAPVSNTASPLAALEQVDRRALLARAMRELAPTLREAVKMRDLMEMSYQEIADQLQLPEGTVKSRINRGRTELARQISRIRENDDRAVAARTSGGGSDPRRSGVAG
jgi:RNA polymerase sigma-70 factor (ECF subfamily)